MISTATARHCGERRHVRPDRHYRRRTSADDAPRRGTSRRFRHYPDDRTAQGSSLIEVLIAICVICIGLLGLAASFSGGALLMATSQPRLIAKEKAAEAIESVFAARDTRTVQWGQIRNVANGGIFLDGAQLLRQPGTDGLANTSDDGEVQSVLAPGADGVFGTSDDISRPLSNFTRELVITDLDVNLRQLRVTVQYRVGRLQQQYVLICYISNYV